MLWEPNSALHYLGKQWTILSAWVKSERYHGYIHCMVCIAIFNALEVRRILRGYNPILFKLIDFRGFLQVFELYVSLICTSIFPSTRTLLSVFSSYLGYRRRDKYILMALPPFEGFPLAWDKEI